MSDINSPSSLSKSSTIPASLDLSAPAGSAPSPGCYLNSCIDQPLILDPQMLDAATSSDKPMPSRVMSSKAMLSKVAARKILPSRRGAGVLGMAVLGCLSLGLGGCSTTLGRSARTEPGPAGAASLQSADQGAGVLEVRANGEDFVRQGFTAKDGWDIAFDHLYVSLTDVEALQTQPPFDPDGDQAPQIVSQQSLTADALAPDLAKARSKSSPSQTSAQTASDLESTVVVDLAGSETPTALVAQFPQAQAGRYNALGWSVVPAATGPSAGQSLQLVGQASKGEQTVAFTLDWDASYRYLCGDFIGDQRKGILKAGDRADLEATFHFDHVFGDIDTPPEDDLNQAALGFAPLAAIATNGQLSTSRAALQTQLSPEDFQRLDKAMAGLAHVGEGHCRKVSVEPSQEVSQ